MRNYSDRKCTVCANAPSYHTIIRRWWEHAVSGDRMRVHGFRLGDTEK